MGTNQPIDITPVEYQEKLANLMQQVFEAGIEIGYDAGYEDGHNDAKESVKSAISDGTRHGSPECARELNGYK